MDRTTRNVTVTEARAMAAQGALLIDVREPREWAAGHIDGSLHVPLGRLEASFVPTGRPIVVVCRSGSRSAIATQLLQAAGRTDVFNMAGGLMAWEAAGLPLVAGTSTVGAGRQP